MRRKSLLRRIVPVSVLLAAAYAAWIGISLLMLPPVSTLANPRASMVITVKDWNGRPHPFVLGPRNRYWTPYAAIPAAMRKAVVASEDSGFFRHEGVDYDAMREAIKSDLREGRFARGGSTITQQVAKNVFLSREKTVTRKIKEIVLAHRIDDTLSKRRILELYLNVVELGPMVYGIGHASRYFFGKSPSALTVRECAFLAAMLPGPKNVYNPYRKLDRVMNRSGRILKRMYGARMIDAEQYRAAMAEVPNLTGLARKVERTLAAPPPEAESPQGADPGGAAAPPAAGGEAGPPEGGGEGAVPAPAPREEPAAGAAP